MVKDLSPEEVYDALISQGAYEEANLDWDVIKKNLSMALEDYAFGKTLRKMPHPSWRVIFNIHYDALRELGDQLMRFKKVKCSNHQGVFAFLVLKFKELDFDWVFLERIRQARNKNKYENLDISREMWKTVELQFDLSISALKREIESKLEKV